MILDDFKFLKDTDNYNVNDIKELMQYVLFCCDEIRNFCKNAELLNEQFYLDWEDQLNEFSVKDPNN